ncbi:organic solute transporter subunit beta [Ornithorhynchus anatinus]|uniref:organic solute transporter subunit beta n=1 Tax=Ornithorhynchus anatinus TaxID=9258 RepID=UPI0004542A4D|nr:organic solute transporter subunit beta [Ornithorhynchus anatinus]XP_016082153.1 organic solute transporter subunit beta [Ornithorhynchus anatinus]
MPLGPTPASGRSPEELEQLWWYYRTEDPTPWNYSMLVLSCLVLVLGLSLLGTNIRNKRIRKTRAREKQLAEAYSQSCSKPLKDSEDLNSIKDGFLSEEPTAGQTIELKERQFTDVKEESTEADV